MFSLKDWGEDLFMPRPSFWWLSSSLRHYLAWRCFTPLSASVSPWSVPLGLCANFLLFINTQNIGDTNKLTQRSYFQRRGHSQVPGGCEIGGSTVQHSTVLMYGYMCAKFIPHRLCTLPFLSASPIAALTQTPWILQCLKIFTKWCLGGSAG